MFGSSNAVCGLNSLHPCVCKYLALANRSKVMADAVVEPSPETVFAACLDHDAMLTFRVSMVGSLRSTALMFVSLRNRLEFCWGQR